MCASAQAATFTVAGTSDQAQGTGSCSASNVCTSLRGAVENVPVGSTITLGAHQYTLSTGPLRVTQSETLSGVGAASTAIKQTKSGAEVIFSDTGALTLNKLTVTGGRRHPSSGDQDLAGGICDAGSSLTLNGVAVSGNTSTGFSPSTSTGGGDAIGGIQIATPNTALRIDSSIVSENVATGGHGGTGNFGGGTAYGAIYDRGSTLEMSGTTISGNSSTGGTGGTNSGVGTGGNAGQSSAGLTINLQGPGGGSITTSTISANQTIGGTGGSGVSGARGANGNSSWGAIDFFNGTLSIRNSLIAGNTNRAGNGGNSSSGQGGNAGSAAGGGVSFGGGGASIVNSTIANNAVTAGTPGTGTPAGSSGGYSGGGLEVQNPASVSLASDTFAGNRAADQGGNIEFEGPTTLIQDTIVAGGTAPFGANCDVGGSPTTDTGYNLESTTPSQCGFSTAHKDVIGSNPLLSPLAANGGPTQTGAFQSQPPKSISTGGIIGKFEFGRPVTCTQGTWSGDGVTSFSYRFSRAGKPIPGATHQSYTMTAKDFGTTLSCTVTATGTYGQASATNSVITAKDCNCTPRLTKVTQSHKMWSRNTGTVFKFKLDRAANVTLRFTGKHGRRGATLTLKGHRGRNRIAFDGRISRHKRLSPGRYAVSISAALAIKGAPSSKPVKLSFTII